MLGIGSAPSRTGPSPSETDRRFELLEKQRQAVDTDTQRAAAGTQRTAHEQIQHIGTSLDIGWLDERRTVRVLAHPSGFVSRAGHRRTIARARRGR